MSKQQYPKFDREILPAPNKYYREEGLKLTGGGELKSAICPFHEDSSPSLRVRLDSAGYRCMACGAHGENIIVFHVMLHKRSFQESALNEQAINSSSYPLKIEKYQAVKELGKGWVSEHY